MAEKKWNNRHSTKEVVPQPEASQPGLEPVWPNYIPPHHLEYYIHTPYDSKFSSETPKQRICGLRKHTFWLAATLAAAFTLIVGLGVGLGVSMSKESPRNNTAQSLVTSPTTISSTVTSIAGSPSSSTPPPGSIPPVPRSGRNVSVTAALARASAALATADAACQAAVGDQKVLLEYGIDSLASIMQRNLTQLARRPASVSQPSGRKNSAPCVFFARGSCRHGQTCLYSHEPPVESSSFSNLPSPIVEKADTRAQVVCHFYVKGGCLKGDSCPFAHPDPDPEVGDVTSQTFEAPAESDEPDDDKPDTWIREIGGVLTQFGDGVAVLKTSFQSDFSAVRISMLPPDSTQASVSKLLSDLGFTVARALDEIRVPPRGNATHCVADVRIEDASFAKRLCDATMNNKSIKVVGINAPMPRGSGSQRVECKKVHCSWHRPLRTVWLNFKSKSTAAKVQARFSAARSTVCGQAVKSSEVTGSKNFHNSQAMTVMLTEVPGNANEVDINKTIPPAIRPMHIELGKPSYQYDMAMVNALVKSKLMEIGPLDWWEDASVATGGKRAKAKGRFQDEGDAVKAATSLNGWAIPFGTKLQLNVQAIYSARFKVLERVFKVVGPLIEAQKASWLTKHVFFTPYKPSQANGQRVLRLEGADNMAVAEAKGILEKVLAGQAAVDDKGEIIWTPAFAVNGGIFQKLKNLEETLGVTIVRNKRLSRLQIFGPAEKCKQAQTLLAKLASEDASTSNAVSLSDDQFEWACFGGFKDLTTILGQKVSFDIISTPKRILVTGTDQDYRLALKMVTACQKHNTPKVEAGNSESQAGPVDCTICWSEAESPAVHTTCGHTYCPDCFETFCFSNANNGNSKSNTPIACAGDSDTCHHPLSPAELQDHLPSRTFEELLEASFASHIRRHPETFRSCPTADCNQLYRSSAASSPSKRIFTCPQCLTAVCTACHASHQGMTCAEHIDMVSGGYAALEEAKKRLGIKDCPKCKTSIEKTEGCNHMTCVGCKTHICWKCLETFTTARACYEHLSRWHNGAFDYE
ncbi:hypothetical protein B0H67DRAFT_554540 [Lasiosphaeris hirsuta]|uniref:Uncharacterized protein n=1 Tax=Lasiosphaeris hirsuta TaxID=260670 RepID=A0AA40AHY5_9PEZI|nr:hypothetical protein B0H67DRAFT_554540 [Lasiosphaeris hirsuta]